MLLMWQIHIPHLLIWNQPPYIRREILVSWFQTQPWSWLRCPEAAVSCHGCLGPPGPDWHLTSCFLHGWRSLAYLKASARGLRRSWRNGQPHLATVCRSFQKPLESLSQLSTGMTCLVECLTPPGKGSRKLSSVLAQLLRFCVCVFVCVCVCVGAAWQNVGFPWCRDHLLLALPLSSPQPARF